MIHRKARGLVSGAVRQNDCDSSSIGSKDTDGYATIVQVRTQNRVRIVVGAVDETFDLLAGDRGGLHDLDPVMDAMCATFSQGRKWIKVCVPQVHVRPVT